MKNLLAQLFSKFESAPMATKAILGGVLLGLLGIAAAALTLANRPHYELLRSGLSADEFARVGEALAGAQVEWRGSQPPGPFVIWVDRSDRARAFDAVMLSGALKDKAGGILSDGSSGMGSVFMYSKEREQLTRKKEWQDMESLLEFQDFIQQARVRTSAVEDGPFGRRAELSASVMIITRHNASLTRAQGHTVAELVRSGLGIRPENVIVADHMGTTVYNGPSDSDGAKSLADWVERAEGEDQRLADEANQLLEQILGPGLARVTVLSDWDYDQSTTLADSADPKLKATVQEQKVSSETPVYGNNYAGGQVGVSSNLADNTNFGVNDAGVVDITTGGSGSVIQPGTATTSEENRTYAPSRVLSETVRRAPVRKRMSVSLWIDETLGSQAGALADAVKAAVGFDTVRNDQFQAVEVPFVELPEEEAAPEAPLDAPTPFWLELLLNRGIELVAAIVFAFVLLSTLKKGKTPKELIPVASPEESSAQAADADPDPELLALEKVRSLLENEPEKVGELLTTWARGEDA